MTQPWHKLRSVEGRKNRATDLEPPQTSITIQYIKLAISKNWGIKLLPLLTERIDPICGGAEVNLKYGVIELSESKNVGEIQILGPGSFREPTPPITQEKQTTH